MARELIQQAKNSEIEQFLNSENEIVVIEEKGWSSVTTFALQYGAPSSLVADMRAKERREGYPTLEKCNKIVDWICGK